jgi:hypothetical protein
MPTELTGIVQGRTIQLDNEPGLPDGQHVTIVIQPAREADPLPPGEGLRRAAGSWDDDPEGLEAYLEWNRQQRKIGRPPLEP